MRFLVLLLMSMAYLMSYAQSPLWSATVDIEMTTDRVPVGEDRCTLLMSRPPTEAIGQADEFSQLLMGGQIMKSILEGKLQSYADPQLSRPLSVEEVNAQLEYYDTVVTFIPETFEESISIVRTLPNPEDYISVGLSIQLDYQSDGRLEQTVLYGFLNSNFVLEGDGYTENPPIYFNVQTVNQPLKFTNRKWNLIDQHITNVPINDLSVAASGELNADQMFEQILASAKSNDRDNFVLTDGSYDLLT
ncbi:MAG: hypothetical protein AAFN65_13660, partial [Bacteroidota bacterium]